MFISLPTDFATCPIAMKAGFQISYEYKKLTCKRTGRPFCRFHHLLHQVDHCAMQDVVDEFLIIVIC